MRLENPDLAFTAQDIRNQRYRSRLEFLDGRTPIQALLIALMDDEGTWTTNYKAEDDVVSAVFCIHKTSLALLHAHSYILPRL